MMFVEAWQTVVNYESKLVRRNWLFRLFIAGVLGYAVAFLVPWDIHREMWWKIAFASSIPARGVYFLNLLQSLVVVFLVCDIQRRRNRAESREVLFVRALGNARMFGAELAGMALPFLVVDVVFMALCLFINWVIPDSPANPWVYNNTAWMPFQRCNARLKKKNCGQNLRSFRQRIFARERR